ncbi:MAG: hypothetical protein K6G50_03040, partial [bacterium]|nr:hypothetical protein [bacterium]
ILADRVKMFKERKEGINYMSSVLDDLRAEERAAGLKIGLTKGRKEGRAEGIDNTIKAISLIKSEKYTLEEIASLSGLPVDKVKALQASLN